MPNASCRMLPWSVTFGWIFFISGLCMFWLFPFGLVLLALSLLAGVVSLFNNGKHGILLIVLSAVCGSGIWFLSFYTRYVIFPDTFRSMEPAERPKDYSSLPKDVV